MCNVFILNLSVVLFFHFIAFGFTHGKRALSSIINSINCVEQQKHRALFLFTHPTNYFLITSLLWQTSLDTSDNESHTLMRIWSWFILLRIGAIFFPSHSFSHVVHTYVMWFGKIFWWWCHFWIEGFTRSLKGLSSFEWKTDLFLSILDLKTSRTTTQNERH